jgi:YD repeat-containing protein
LHNKTALGYLTTTVYDNASQTIALVDARSNRHSFTYDAAGRRTATTDPLGRITTAGLRRGNRQSTPKHNLVDP